MWPHIMQYRIRKGLDTRRRPTAKGDETGRPNDDDHINISLALFLFDVTLYSVLLYRTSTVAVLLFTYVPGTEAECYFFPTRTLDFDLKTFYSNFS